MTARPDKPLRIAYVMSRFPKLTETFILFEMLALLSQGVDLEIHPLLRARNSASHPEGAGLFGKFRELFRAPVRAAVMHPEVEPLMDRVHFRPLLSLPILAANLRALLTRPRRYFGAVAALVRGAVGSANFLLGGLILFPRTVAAAFVMEKHGVDHVHAHFANHPAAMAFVIHRLTGIPYSFTAHGADLQVDQHMLCEKIRESVFTATVSEYNRRFMIEHCGAGCADKLVVIRCGVDRSVFERTEARSEPAGRLRLVCIGTLYEVKGQAYLLEACRKLLDANVPFLCRFIGEGPDRDALVAKTGLLGLNEHVEFLGRCPRDRIVRVLHDSDVQVVPSVPTAEGRREGIPVVCMEGMAGGVVVVASNISGIPEVVEDGVNGLLVPPRDPDAIAEAVQRLYRDPPLRARLAGNARQRIADDYDLYRNAGRLLAKIRGEAP